MRNINPKKFHLIIEEGEDYFHADIINLDLIEDGTNPSVDELDERQAKIALCLAIKRMKEDRISIRNAVEILNGY